MEASLGWLRKAAVVGSGIRVSSNTSICYPEVTGYLIPTLLNWGERDLAIGFGDWLVTIQDESGSWFDPSGAMPYTFDTGQILKGLVALLDVKPEYEAAIVRGCDWLLGQIEESGRVVTPDTGAWELPGGRSVPEAIHLYALTPLREAGTRWNIERYTKAVLKAQEFYLQDSTLVEFRTLSHFHAYILEALLDLGHPERVAPALDEIAGLQMSDGSVPAYKDAYWVCSTGVAQYSLIAYRMGRTEEADRMLSYMCRRQEKSGGFRGSYGRGADYFPHEEISWACKFFLDACYWKIGTSFSREVADFPSEIDATDGRLRAVLSHLPDGDSEILDIGCGKGRFAKHVVARSPSSSVYGLDVSEAMASSLPEGVLPVVGSMLRIPFDDGCFDYAYAVESLEHAVNVDGAIREMVRVLKPGGKLTIVDKNRAMLGRLEIAPWETWFDAAELESQLAKYCSRVEVVQNIGYDASDGADNLFIAWVGTK